MYYYSATSLAETLNFILGWEEKDDQYILNIAVPGIKKEDLSVKIKKNELLIIKGKGSLGNVDKWYQIPEEGLAEKLTAKLKDGVLTVTVPKESNEKEIEIN